MRRPALSLPRFAARLFAAFALSLATACSSVSPPARPANPPVANLPPPPSPAERPPVAQQALPVPGGVPGAAPLPAFGAPGRATTAALLVPLTGPSAAIGSALLNAAQLALFEVGGNDFTLLPFDTRGTAEGAQAAAGQAIAQHVDIVLGPLFSGEAKAAGAITRQAQLPMLAFTADQTAAGNGVYVLGFLPGPQALRVVDYAHSQNRTRLAILAPSNDYGRIVVDYLSNNAASVGMTVSGLAFYDPRAVDLTQAVKRLVKPDPHNPGDVGFDALMLPDEGERLGQVASMLPLQGIDPQRVRLLGTMLWEDSHPGAIPALAGGWYPAPAQGGHTDFDNRYARAFGAKPPRLAALGYDAAALAAVLARRNPHDYAPAVLTNPLGFAGVDGIFRLRPDGTAERGYAVMEVEPNGPPQEVSPAPAQFQAAY